MHVLGVKKAGHDSSAAILVDGRLVAAAQEERFSRKKRDGGFPFQAIAYCLREARLSMQDIEVLAFQGMHWVTLPYLDLLRLLVFHQTGAHALLSKLLLQASGDPHFCVGGFEASDKAEFVKRFGVLPPVKRV